MLINPIKKNKKNISTYADGVVVLNVGAGKPATVVETPKKTEMVGALYEIIMENAREGAGDKSPRPQRLNVRFTDTLDFAEKKGVWVSPPPSPQHHLTSQHLTTRFTNLASLQARKLTFSKDESLGSKVAFKTHGNTTVVSVSTGLEKTAGDRKSVV